MTVNKQPPFGLWNTILNFVTLCIIFLASYRYILENDKVKLLSFSIFISKQYPFDKTTVRSQSLALFYIGPSLLVVRE